MNKKFLVGFIFMMLLVNIIPISADVDYQEFEDITQSSDNFRNQMILHSGGKLFVSWFDTTYTYGKLRIIGFNGNGEILTDFEIASSLEVYTGFKGYVKIKISELDDDEILIGVWTKEKASPWKHYFRVVRLNINTYNYNIYSLMIYDAGELAKYRTASFYCYEYNDDIFYVMHNYYETYYIQYDPDTNTLSKKDNLLTSGDQNYDSGLIGIALDDDYLDEIYFVSTVSPDYTIPKYYKVDIGSNELTLLATHPMSQRYTSDVRMTYIGGGVVKSGNDTYLYFQYVAPLFQGTPPNERKLAITEHILKFNNTISTEHLLVQYDNTIVLTLNLGVSSTVCWVLGYPEDYDSFWIYYPNRIGGTVTFLKRRFYVENFFNSDTSSLQIESATETTDIPNMSEDDIIGKKYTTKYQMNQHVVSGNIRVYFDVPILQKVYSLELNYIPYDVPPKTYTNYLFKAFSFMNDIAEQTIMVVYFDSGQIKSGETSISGELDFYLQTSVSGYHDLKIRIYDDGVEQYNKTYSYVFTDKDIEKPSDIPLIPIVSSLMITFIPIMVVIMVPTLALASQLGLIGGIFGFGIGVVMAVMSGLIPMYAMYLFMLMIAIAFVYMLKM